MKKKLELLAPAGDAEKLKMAILYGADAVYMGGEEYGLRANAGNFGDESMGWAIDYAHQHGVKAYITMNIFAHNADFIDMEEYIRHIADLKPDGVIVSDPGIFSLVTGLAPDLQIHISTQANNTNFMSANFWHKQGATRVILARELSLTEIAEIRKKTHPELELEAFVHGAMCISYSGRCLLSSYMTGRDSNKGDCSHPCRWNYHLVEEKRPGEYLPVYENERGTFIFNSKDLCMIEHIPELIESGIMSLKIEGRMKSAYYVATVIKAYREAIDAYIKSPEEYLLRRSEFIEEVSKVSHRDFTTGFYFGDAKEAGQIYSTSSYVREYDFIGLVKQYDELTGIATVEQRNRMIVGDEIEVVPPKGDFFTQKIEWIEDKKGERIETAPHPQMIIKMPIKYKVPENTILRVKASSL